MKVRGSGGENEKIEPQMAPMIDVVFQLLIFFMLTLKIIEPEGDFPINMPQGRPDPDPKKKVSIEPVVISLQANDDGTLNAVQFAGNPAMQPEPVTDGATIAKFIEDNSKEFPNYDKASGGEKAAIEARAARRAGEEQLFEALRQEVAKYVIQQRDIIQDKEKLEKELKAKIQFSYNLQYRYLVEATSACRARNKDANGQPIRREDLIKNVEFIRPAPPES